MINPMISDQQHSAIGTIVSLYTIDASNIGGRVMRFTSGPFNGAQVQYDNNSYVPLPIKVSGIKYGGSGATARPTLTISRANNNLITGYLGADGWRGATFKRIRTLTKYLDGEPSADPNRHWPADIFRIEQKSSDAKDEIRWTLASVIDFDKKKLPGRQILRDVCVWRYRRYDGLNFDYTGVKCPYAGSDLFTDQDQPVTDPAQDRCSRRLSGCQRRFPNGVVPFSGFAGVGRV